MNYTMAAGPNQPPIMNFARLSENAFTPTRGTERSAGFDLYR